MHGLFWGSILLVAYAYAGYPLCLRVLHLFSGSRGKKPVPATAVLPSVTLLISAYNEEEVIGKKVDNALALDYLAGLLEVLVVSDGSTDRTDAIVAAQAARGVRLVRTGRRMGKSAGLNLGVSEAKGEILVFSDANSLYEPQAIRELVRPFADPAVGFVTGGTSYQAEGGSDVHRPVGLYARLEQATKRLESGIGSCVGADGAIFAVRRALWRPLEAYDLNDLVVPLGVVRQRRRGVYQPSARCMERTARSVGGEFARQVRITGRTLRALAGALDLLNPIAHGVFAWELFSHKVCKLLVPFALILALAANLLLVPAGRPWLALLALQFLGYAAGVLGLLRSGGPRGGGALSVPAVFLAASAAVLLGWVRFAQGETFTMWGTSR